MLDTKTLHMRKLNEDCGLGLQMRLGHQGHTAAAGCMVGRILPANEWHLRWAIFHFLSSRTAWESYPALLIPFLSRVEGLISLETLFLDLGFL